MNILIVYAHHEPSSFTAAMKNVAVEVLSTQGHSVTVTDLYGLGFSPIAQKWDFVATSGGHFNYMLEQKHAANLNMAFSPDVLGEIEKLKMAELVLFITPLWWSTVPAILKGWFDRVLAMGVAWDGNQMFETGLMRGRQAMLITAGGQPMEYYRTDGAHKSDITTMLHHINHGTLAFCGFNVHEPFYALNILGQNQSQLELILKELEFRLQHIDDSPQWLISYN